MKRKLLKPLICFLLVPGFTHSQTWDSVGKASPNSSIIRGLFFLDSSVGYAVSESGEIAMTVNGGSNWIVQDTGIGVPMRAIQFLDSNTGYACGFSGIILKTTDGGNNWIKISNNIPQDLRCIHFITTQIGFAGGSTGIIYRTFDGGVTWDTLDLSIQSDIIQLHFLDAFTGFLVTSTSNFDFGKIFKTSDGGNTWSPSYQSDTIGFLGLAVGNSKNIVAGGSWQTLVRTTTGGSTWNTSYQGTINSPRFRCGYAPSGNEMYLGDDGGNIFSTENSGLTWTSSLVGTAGIYSIHFPDAITGYAGNSIGEIFKLCKVPPMPSDIIGFQSVCSGDSAIYSTSSIPGADSYNWFVPAGSVFNFINDTTILVHFGTSSGYVGVEGKNICGVGDSATLFVNVSETPAISITYSSGELISSGGQVSDDYQWYFNGVAIPGANSSTYIPAETGEYYLIVIPDGGCGGQSNTIFVALEPLMLKDYINPQLGSYHYTYAAAASSLDPGISGCVVTNYLLAGMTDSADYTETFISPNQTAYAGEFSEANVATLHDNVYAFYESNSSQWAIAGYASDDYVLHYPEPLPIFTYPMNCDESITNSSFVIYDNSGLQMHRAATITSHYDGYGYLYTPSFSSGTFAIRIHEVESYIDSAFLNGEFLAAYTSAYDNYFFFGDSTNGKLKLEFQTFSFDDGNLSFSSKYVRYLNESVDVEESKPEENQWHVYADYHTRVIRIFGDFKTSHQTNFSMFDLSGRVLMQADSKNFSGGDGSYVVPMPQSSLGMLLFRINDSNRSSTFKIMLWP